MCSIVLRWIDYLGMYSISLPSIRNENIEACKDSLKKDSKGNIQRKNITCKEISSVNMQRAVKRQRTPSDCSGSAASVSCSRYKYHPRHYTRSLCTFRILTVGVMLLLVKERHKIISTAA